MPSDKVIAPAIDMPVFSARAPASTTPTAIPSGMLCSVTASTNMVERPKPVLTPSGTDESIWMCGTTLSNSSNEKIPARKPTVAGTHPTPPLSTVMSIDGSRSDHTEAAIITPEANPNSSFCNHGAISRRSKNTIAAPSEVPKKGTRRPYATSQYKPPPYFRFSK